MEILCDKGYPVLEIKTLKFSGKREFCHQRMKKRDESLGAKRTVRYTTLPVGDYDSDDNNSWDKGSMNLIHHKIKSQNDNLDELERSATRIG